MGGVEGEERKMHRRVEGREGGIKNFITKYKLLTHLSIPPSLPPFLLTDIESLVHDSMRRLTTLPNSSSRGSVMPNWSRSVCSSCRESSRDREVLLGVAWVGVAWVGVACNQGRFDWPAPV